MIEIGN